MKQIFIIGEQRSGSNLLRLMLAQAGIAAPHPPHVLQRMLPLESSYGDLREDLNWSQLVEDVCTLVDRNPVPWTEVNPLDRAGVMERCRARSVVAVFGAVMDMYAQARGATAWACKSMQYSEFADEIEEYFVAPKYLYLYRDGRDVTLSFKHAVVGDKHPYFIAREWSRLQRAAAMVRERVGSGRCFDVCYEDLTADPEPLLRSLTDFLGIAFQPSMMEFHRSSEAREASRSSQLWQNLGQPLIRNNSKKFLTGLTREEVEIVESVAGADLERLGYERVYVPAGQERVFDSEQVAAFSKENERLKHEHRSAMDAEDAERRSHQLSLLTERVQHLRHLPSPLLLRLLPYLEERHLDAGTEFIQEGSIERHLFFIIEGVAEVLEGSQVIARMEKGECIGEVGALSGLARTRSVRAATPIRLFYLSTVRMEHMLGENPELAAWLLWSISISLATKFHNVASQHPGEALDPPADPLG